MNLLFLADSDHLGQSGVGDFALTLSVFLKKLNIHSSVASIGPPGSSLRLQLTEYVREAQPDWVSFQFVPYAFAHRGLVGPRTLPWDSLRGRIGTHFMFHEIWIGAHQGASLYQRSIGFLQRTGIQAIVRELRPDVVHCTNHLYSSMLSSAGIPNRLLPLFGSIPPPSPGPDPYSEALGSLVPGSKRSDWLVAALFGSIYPSENLLPALKWLQDRSLRTGKRLLVVSLGHSPTAATFFESLTPQLPEAGRPHVLVKGRMDSSILSRWLSGADCALATTPFNVIDKSSSAVAFAELGVPVIVVDPGASVRGVHHSRLDLSPEYWLFGDHRLNRFDNLPPRRPPQPRLERVARQFLADINGVP
jgi:hypothetical protein